MITDGDLDVRFSKDPGAGERWLTLPEGTSDRLKIRECLKTRVDDAAVEVPAAEIFGWPLVHGKRLACCCCFLGLTCVGRHQQRRKPDVEKIEALTELNDGANDGGSITVAITCPRDRSLWAVFPKVDSLAKPIVGLRAERPARNRPRPNE